MREDKVIRCNMCYTIYESDEYLKMIELSRDEFIKGCEKCSTDEYLMDINKSEV